MTERPSCPRCGSTHIISKGDDWNCKDCNRWFSKEYHPRGADNPKCVYCESENVWSKGENWWCNACRKYWKKKYSIDKLIQIQLTNHDRGWLEALIDGEGYLGLYKQKTKGRKGSRKKRGRFKWEIKGGISMSSKECMEELARIVKVKKPYSRKVKKRTPNSLIPKNQWCVDITPNKLRVILPQIRLIVKERQRLLFIEALELIWENQQSARWHPEIVKQNDIRLTEIHDKMKELNRKGRASQIMD